MPWLVSMTLGAVPLAAQSERGTIMGAVTDASGAAIPNARITITNTGTQAAVSTRKRRNRRLRGSQRPDRQLQRQSGARGFLDGSAQRHHHQCLGHRAGRHAAQARGNQDHRGSNGQRGQLQTSDAKTSATVTNKMVDELPLVVGGTLRSPFDLAVLTPEAKNLGGDNGFILGGGQAAGYGTTLDGISTNTTRALSKSWVSSNSPSLEAVTEFTVDTNGFKAEYGHAGGGVMTFVFEVRHQRVPRLGLRIPAQQRFRRQPLLQQLAPAFRAPSTSRTISAPASAVRSGFRRFTTARTRRSSSSPMRVSATASGANGGATTVPTPEMYNGDFSKWVNSANKLMPIYDPTTQVTESADGSRDAHAVRRQQDSHRACSIRCR